MSKRIIARVFLIRDGKYVMVARKYQPEEYGGQFGANTFALLPGGGIDPEETLEEGAIRECSEELGVTVKSLTKLCVYENEERALHFYISEYGTGWEGEPDIKEPEKFEGLVWISPYEMIHRSCHVWKDHWFTGDGIGFANIELVCMFPGM